MYSSCQLHSSCRTAPKTKNISTQFFSSFVCRQKMLCSSKLSQFTSQRHTLPVLSYIIFCFFFMHAFFKWLCGGTEALRIYPHLYTEHSPDAPTFKLLHARIEILKMNAYILGYGRPLAQTTFLPVAMCKHYVWKYYTTRCIRVFVGSRQA